MLQITPAIYPAPPIWLENVLEYLSMEIVLGNLF